MRILSLNVWGGRVHDLLLRYLSLVNADVYCLQEVYHTREAMPPVLRFAPKFKEAPVYPNLFSEIVRVLPNHQGTFLPEAYGYVHDGLRTDKPLEFGSATFIRKSIPVIEQVQRFVC